MALSNQIVSIAFAAGILAMPIAQAGSDDAQKTSSNQEKKTNQEMKTNTEPKEIIDKVISPNIDTGVKGYGAGDASGRGD